VKTRKSAQRDANTAR